MWRPSTATTFTAPVSTVAACHIRPTGTGPACTAKASTAAAWLALPVVRCSGPLYLAASRAPFREPSMSPTTTRQRSRWC